MKCIRTTNHVIFMVAAAILLAGLFWTIQLASEKGFTNMHVYGSDLPKGLTSTYADDNTFGIVPFTMLATSTVTMHASSLQSELDAQMQPEIQSKAQPTAAAVNAVAPAAPVVTPAPQPSEYTLTSLGTFKAYHYCPCATCNGNTHQKTASGTTLTDGRTIAVDASIIPLGSVVVINGHEYVAEDTGVRGQKIDIFVNAPHDQVYNMGVKEVEVFLKVKNY